LNLASSTTSLIGYTPSSLDTVKFAEYRREYVLLTTKCSHHSITLQVPRCRGQSLTPLPE